MNPLGDRLWSSVCLPREFDRSATSFAEFFLPAFQCREPVPLSGSGAISELLSQSGICDVSSYGSPSSPCTWAPSACAIWSIFSTIGLSGFFVKISP